MLVEKAIVRSSTAVRGVHTGVELVHFHLGPCTTVTKISYQMTKIKRFMAGSQESLTHG